MRMWPILLLITLPVFTGCDYAPFGFTEIGEIRERATALEGQEVKVRGEVTEIAKIPFLDTRMYTLRDDTGEITVFALEELPRQGEKVAVKGKIESAAIIGGESFGVRLKEVRRLPGYLAR